MHWTNNWSNPPHIPSMTSDWNLKLFDSQSIKCIISFADYKSVWRMQRMLVTQLPWTEHEDNRGLTTPPNLWEPFCSRQSIGRSTNWAVRPRMTLADIDTKCDKPNLIALITRSNLCTWAIRIPTAILSLQRRTSWGAVANESVKIIPSSLKALSVPVVARHGMPRSTSASNQIQGGK